MPSRPRSPRMPAPSPSWPSSGCRRTSARTAVARMSPVKKIKEIQQTVSIPVMAKCRIGHFVEAQILEALGVDFIDESEVLTEAKNLGAPYELLRWVAEHGKLPVPNFSAGGIATPADAALMMQLGAEAVFVGSGIFKSADPAARAKAVVQATTHFKNPDILVKVSEDLGEAMPGIETSKLKESDLLQTRGW